MAAKSEQTISKTLRKSVQIAVRAADKLEAKKDEWLIKGRGRAVTVRLHLGEQWPAAARMVIDASALKGQCEININHHSLDDEHTLVVEIITQTLRKQSVLRIRDIDMLHVQIDERAKIEFKAEVNGIQFYVRPSRDEVIEFDSHANELNFFNGFRKINVDLSKKLHVELNADQIIDDIKI